MATDWQDVEVMAIISGRDMIAIEAKSTGQKKLLTGVEQDWKILAKAAYKNVGFPAVFASTVKSIRGIENVENKF